MQSRASTVTEATALCSEPRGGDPWGPGAPHPRPRIDGSRPRSPPPGPAVRSRHAPRAGRARAFQRHGPGLAIGLRSGARSSPSSAIKVRPRRGVAARQPCDRPHSPWRCRTGPPAARHASAAGCKVQPAGCGGWLPRCARPDRRRIGLFTARSKAPGRHRPAPPPWVEGTAAQARFRAPGPTPRGIRGGSSTQVPTGARFSRTRSLVGFQGDIWSPTCCTAAAVRAVASPSRAGCPSSVTDQRVPMVGPQRGGARRVPPSQNTSSA